jgi:hypothetical protein
MVGILKRFEMKNPIEVLAELARRNGHLMHDVVSAEVNLYDGNPVAGSPRGSQQRVPFESFANLRDNGWITKAGGREVCRYKINEAGRAALISATRL